METELDAVLSILQKKPFDRTRKDVQLLAKHLLSQRGFFGGMREDVVELLCTIIGHAFVEEGSHVFKQGQIGDCMYVAVKGYCSVLKHPQPDPSSNTAADSSAAHSSSSNSGSGSQHASRRATMEQQTQHFALATAAVSGSRRGTLEELQHHQHCTPAVAAAAAAVGLMPEPGAHRGPQAGGAAAAAAGPAGSRRCTGEAGRGLPGSRRATAEQLVQQQLGEAVHLGWVGEGESFGESALLTASKPRAVSVVAGDGGVLLAVLDRAAYNRLQMQAQSHQPVAAAALQSVLAAACRPLLQSPPGKRSAEVVESLADLLAGLEAFRSLPQPVRARLAKSCQAVALPDGAVVFEEDQKGDAMYVVMSGCCQVRARPLIAPQARDEGCQGLSGPGLGPGLTDQAGMAAAGQAGPRGPAAAGADNKRRSTTEVALAGVGGVSGVRRTTWEGVAFTAQEQAKLEAVRAALEADKRKNDPTDQPNSSSGSAATGPGIHRDKAVERDGLFWTAKFMSDAVASATAADPHWGLQGGMTPLAAVFAAKWRQQVRKQQAAKHVQQQQDEEAAEADKSYAAMEELLGKAAAKAWKAARDNNNNNINVNNTETQNPFPPGPNSNEPEGASGSTSQKQLNAAAGAQLGSFASSNSSGSSSKHSSFADRSGTAGADAVQQGLASPSGSSAGDASTASTPRPTGASAAATAANLLAAAAAAGDPAEALKLQLAALGVKDPADVSRRLLHEVGARADLQGLLVSVASLLERKGLPRRLSKKGSLKITKELNKRMLGGASWKGYGGSSNPSNNPTGSSDAKQEAQPSADPAPAGRRAVGFTDQPGSRVHAGAGVTAPNSSRDMRVSGDDGGSELGTEATGMSCDWRSSLDGSEAASLCNSLDIEDAGAYGYGGYGAYGGAAVGASSDVGSSAMADRRTGSGSLELGLGLGHKRSGSGCGLLNPAVPRLPSGMGGLGPAKPQAAVALSCDECDELYGPVIKTLQPGDSFGELALLQRSATRTATVMVAPGPAAAAAAAADGGVVSDGSAAGCDEEAGAGQAGEAAAVTGQDCSGSGGGALLIRISRSCYDATVRSLQVAALEELLGFLSGLAPFKGLSRELLTSLAVFVRPVSLGQGQLLAVAGERADALMIIQEGEVKLLDAPAGALSAAGASLASGYASSAAAAAGTGSAVPVLPRSRRATADELLRMTNHQTSSSTGTAAGGVPSAASSRLLIRQLTNPHVAGQLQQQAGASAHGPGGAASSSSSGSGSAGGGQGAAGLPAIDGAMSALSLGRIQQACAPLAVLGPGSLLGENVLGYNAEQDPLQAIAAAKTHKARQAAAAAAAALTHQATAVAVRPCRVLVLSAAGLRRFGRRVRGPLAQLAADRRDFLQHRRTALQDTKSSLAQMMSDMRQQIDAAAAAAKRPPAGTVSSSRSPNSMNTMPSIFNKSNSLNHRSFLGPATGVLPGSAAQLAGMTSSSSSSISMTVRSSGSIPTTAMMRHTGSGNGSGGSSSSSSSSSSSAAARPSASQWQQQQWQQQAFGELLHPQPALQQLTVADVARLKQVVPGAAAPCVSETAAAARAFPVGALNAAMQADEGAFEAANAAAAPGSQHSFSVASSTVLKSSAAISRAGGNAKGLRLLLGPQQQGQAAEEALSSPCWTVGPGGRVTAACSAAATAAAADHVRCGKSTVAIAAAAAAGGGSGGGWGDGCSAGRSIASDDGSSVLASQRLPPCGRRAPLGRELSACSSLSES